jgi:CheY-like chemotaxis protein
LTIANQRVFLVVRILVPFRARVPFWHAVPFFHRQKFLPQTITPCFTGPDIAQRPAVGQPRADKAHLVLMDIQMPGMDGFEATATIREKEKSTGKHIPIVAMTAHALEGDQDRCMSAGMDGYVSKPIRSMDLFAVMEPLLVIKPGINSLV